MAEAAPDNTETVGTGRLDTGVLGRLAAVQTDLRFHLGRDQGSSFCKKRFSDDQSQHGIVRYQQGSAFARRLS